jgi:hypothetical protein
MQQGLIQTETEFILQPLATSADTTLSLTRHSKFFFVSLHCFTVSVQCPSVPDCMVFSDDASLLDDASLGRCVRDSSVGGHIVQGMDRPRLSFGDKSFRDTASLASFLDPHAVVSPCPRLHWILTLLRFIFSGKNRGKFSSTSSKFGMDRCKVVKKL